MPKKSYEIDPGFVYKQENLIISVFVGNQRLGELTKTSWPEFSTLKNAKISRLN